MRRFSKCVTRKRLDEIGYVSNRVRGLEKGGGRDQGVGVREVGVGGLGELGSGNFLFLLSLKISMKTKKRSSRLSTSNSPPKIK